MEKVSMQVRMPLKLKEKLEQIAKQKGLTINAIIVQELWNIWFKSYKMATLHMKRKGDKICE